MSRWHRVSSTVARAAMILLAAAVPLGAQSHATAAREASPAGSANAGHWTSTTHDTQPAAPVAAVRNTWGKPDTQAAPHLRAAKPAAPASHTTTRSARHSTVHSKASVPVQPAVRLSWPQDHLSRPPGTVVLEWDEPIDPIKVPPAAAPGDPVPSVPR